MTESGGTWDFQEDSYINKPCSLLFPPRRHQRYKKKPNEYTGEHTLIIKGDISSNI